MSGRKFEALGLGLLFCAACTPAARPPLQCPEVTVHPVAEPARATIATSDATSASELAEPAPPKPDGSVTPNDDQVVYRAELEDRSISLQQQVRHLNWTCQNGSCQAKGPTLRIGAKSCVSFGASVGAVVSRFQFGEQQLDSQAMASCQTALRKLEAEGKFRSLAQQRQRAQAQPSGLSPRETYFEVTNYVGQMQLSDGSLRFVFVDGSVALVRPDRTLFRFDAERRLNDSGRFVRWHSAGGEYTGTDPISTAVLAHCSRTNGGITIEPWQIRHASTLSPACDPHRADFLAVFKRESLPASAVSAARAALFEAPYADATRWKQTARGSSDPVVVGSAESVPGYAHAPARDLLERVRTAVATCAPYASDPTAQIRGEVLLIIGAFGAPKSVLLRRTTYPDPERFSVCIEQRLMQQKYQSTSDLSVRVPFQLGDR